LSSIERLKESLKKANEAEKLIESTDQHRQKISRIQKLFKYNSPATESYVKTQMQKMSSCINGYLSSFGASYKVKLHKNNDFLCIFNDRTISSEELSGGEKVILSLAFRFAASELFTSNVNMIVLDEPTIWLDSRRIDGFKEVLENVKAVSKRNDSQVFIITHEKSLIPVFDQVVSF
jgi:DNA repair exonuclease SbcCD ATPase subunit